MAPEDHCSPWDHSHCTGTEDCPPRCPCFVNAQGARILIQPADHTECHADWLEWDVPDGENVTLLAAHADDELVGLVALDENGLVSVDVAPTHRDDGLPDELLRHAMAYAAGAGHNRLRVIDPDFDDQHLSALGMQHDGVAWERDLGDRVATAVQLPPVNRVGAPCNRDDLETPILNSRSLDGLFNPNTVAVVGASERPGSLGRIVMSNLDDAFSGTVIPVNPRAETILGRRAYPDLDAISDSVDLVIVMTPPDAALDAVEAAGERGVPNVVVISAGFGETDDAGVAREERLAALADQYGMTLVGPNSLGILNTSVHLNASFCPTQPPTGGISLMSQSGACITAAVAWGRDNGIGFNHIVSLGNKTVLDEVDLLEYWDGDPDTDVILAYLEGLEDGPAFVRAARDVTKTTPVVVLKAGASQAGARAAASHTGTLSGRDAGYDAAFAQAGVIRATDVESFYDSARALASQPLPAGPNVGIVTNAGGPGVLAADGVEAVGLSLSTFTDATRERIDDLAPSGSSMNPVDVLGDADIDRFEAAIDAVLGDEHVDAGLVLTTPHPLISYPDLVARTRAVQNAHDKPVTVALMGGVLDGATRDAIAEHDVAVYPTPERAAAGLVALVEYREITERSIEPPRRFDDVDPARAREILTRGDVSGPDAMDALEAYGIPTPGGGVARSSTDADAIAETLSGDVVLKVVSQDVPHKSDAGGVRIGVSRDAVAATYDDIVRTVTDHHPDAAITGVAVQEQINVDDGVETIVGVTRDAQFGPLVMFGLGGIYVETLEDVAFRIAPFTDADATAMVDELDGAPILHGARGHDSVDIGALTEAIQRLGQLAVDVPEIAALDVNPLLATADGVVALDFHVEMD